VLPPLDDAGSATTGFGDLWLLGRHRLLCGDPRTLEAFEELLQGDRADLIFTDPPYNVPAECGLGRIRHRDFAMGVGEMSSEAFTAFLGTTLGNAANSCRDGAIAFVCMDWRHMGELLAAGHATFAEFKDFCVWTKSSGGMSSLYRSKHELVFVFKVGDAPHTSAGDSGRHRNNVWDHAGVALPLGRNEDLAVQPTVKPVALVADAIKDCTRRGAIVLDPFAGAGTTLIAAEKTGRQGRLIECDPAFCDRILRRFAAVTGKQPRLAATGQDFKAIADARAPSATYEEGVP